MASRCLAPPRPRRRLRAENLHFPSPSMEAWRLRGSLLIENDLSSAEGLASLLEKWGCDVAISTSAAAAVDRSRALDEVPDVIVADLHLDNGETGIEAVEEIRNAIKTDVPAIIVTADYSAKAASDAASFGHELLKKPIKPAEMRSLLSFLLT